MRCGLQSLAKFILSRSVVPRLVPNTHTNRVVARSLVAMSKKNAVIDLIVSSDDDADVGKAAKAKKPAVKRPAKKDLDAEAGDASPKAKKPRAKKLSGPEVDELGWTCVPPSLFYR
jgi:hypothetical protein